MQGCSRCLCVLGLLVAVPLALAGDVDKAPASRTGAKAALLRKNAIEPELENPGTFTKHDYPDDLRPKALHKFDHPFPTLQDDDDYDKDYVKDENNDAGEWESQMAYDTARNKLSNIRKQLRDAEKTKEEKAADYAVMRERVDYAKGEAHAHGTRYGAAQGAASEAEKEVDSTMDDIAGATKKVDVEVKDVQACQEKLEAARKKLKDLMNDSVEAKAQIKSLEEEKDEAESTEVDAEQGESSSEEKLAAAVKSHKEADEAYHNHVKDVAKLEKDLAVAEARLRKFRNKAADDEGAVTATEYAHDAKRQKSGAGRAVPVAMVLVLALCLQ